MIKHIPVYLCVFTCVAHKWLVRVIAAVARRDDTQRPTNQR